jgi:hypothetical protein
VIKLLESLVALVMLTGIVMSCAAIAGFLWLSFKFINAFAAFAA